MSAYIFISCSHSPFWSIGRWFQPISAVDLIVFHSVQTVLASLQTHRVSKANLSLIKDRAKVIYSAHASSYFESVVYFLQPLYWRRCDDNTQLCSFMQKKSSARTVQVTQTHLKVKMWNVAVHHLNWGLKHSIGRSVSLRMVCIPCRPLGVWEAELGCNGSHESRVCHGSGGRHSCRIFLVC